MFSLKIKLSLTFPLISATDLLVTTTFVMSAVVSSQAAAAGIFGNPARSTAPTNSYGVNTGITGGESQTTRQDITNQSATSSGVAGSSSGGYSQASGIFGAMCSMCKKFCPWCPMSSQSSMMALQMANAMRAAAYTRASVEMQNSMGGLSGFNNLRFTPSLLNVDGDPETVERIPAEYARELNRINPNLVRDLEDYMRTMDKNGYQLNNGKVVYPLAVAGSEEARSSKEANEIGELTPEQLAEQKGVFAKVAKRMGITEAELKSRLKGFGDSSAVAATGDVETSTGPAANAANSDFKGSSDWWKKLPHGSTRLPAAAAASAGLMASGKSVIFNGEPVGVAGDNIFRMIRYRYDLKREQLYFLPP